MRYYNGNLITASENNTTSDTASGVFNIEYQLIARNASKWPVVPDPTEDFIEISSRLVFNHLSTDYVGNYDVTEVSIPSTFSGSARIYLGQKVTSPTNFYSDIAVAAVQILNNAGDTLLKSWVFNGSTTTWENLGTATAISGSSTQGFPESLATSAARTYGGTVPTGAQTDKWSLVSGTASSNTGAADGIGNTYKESDDGGNGTILSLGNNIIGQSSGTNYIYVETSPVDTYEGFVVRSDAYTFSGGEKIRVAHLLAGNVNDQMDPDDTLYLGVA